MGSDNVCIVKLLKKKLQAKDNHCLMWRYRKLLGSRFYLKASGAWGPFHQKFKLLFALYLQHEWANSNFAMKGQGTDVHSIYE
jgi:hypothetical protein